ncbi:MAG: hypothetical protein WBA10_12760 [Elainellaceae cyanobacterium]
MTQRIRLQAQQFWQALAGSKTRQSYRSALTTTWTIIREGSLLLWLLICLVLVAFDWGTATAIAAGRASRDAVSRLDNIQSDTIVADTKQTLLSVGKTSVAATLAQARGQLGLPSAPESATSPSESVTDKPPAPSQTTATVD